MFINNEQLPLIKIKTKRNDGREKSWKSRLIQKKKREEIGVGESNKYSHIEIHFF